MLKQDYVSRVVQVLSQYRYCPWSIGPLYSVTSSSSCCLEHNRRLQGAVNSEAPGSSGYKVTDYTGVSSKTNRRGTALQVANDIKQQVGNKYRKVQGGKGLWRQRMRAGYKYNRANRSNYVKDNGDQYMTFFFSMLGDLNIWTNQNWQHSNQEKTQVCNSTIDTAPSSVKNF